MTEAQCLELAERYLTSRNIGFLRVGRVGTKEQNRWEAIFPVPESIDPNVAVIDPPDVRVWVTVEGHVELIHQM